MDNDNEMNFQPEDKWEDWYTNTYDYTVGSVNDLDKKDIYEYISKIRLNMENNISIYSEEYLNECIMYIELILNGSYEYIDLLENIGAYYPHKEEFIECLKRLSEIKS